MIELQDVLEAHADEYLAARRASPQQLKALRDIRACRTAALGGHADVCPECGEVTYSYNSCRNRHCPKCQGYERERWVDARSRDLLDVGYFHLVFTVPAELNAAVYANQRELYSLLFRCAWETVSAFAADGRFLGAEVGAVAVLHTWGRKLQYHPHVHMIVTGGGLARGGRWRACGRSFFAPVRAMSRVFRGKFLDGVSHLASSGALPRDPAGALAAAEAAGRRDWVVYAKPPFADAACTVRYLGRYTHRVAISNGRLLSDEGGRVSFLYRDSADGDREKVCELDALEFVRRFLMHVLPPGFCKKRHYGLLANRGKSGKLALCRRLTGTRGAPVPAPTPAEIVERMIGRPPGTCRHCGRLLLPLHGIPRPMRC